MCCFIKKGPFSLKYRITRILFFLPTFPFVKKIVGFQNLPKSGPFIIAPNHTSHFDWIVLLIYLTRYLKRHVHFFSTIKYAGNPLFKYLVDTSQGIWMDPKEPVRSFYVGMEYLKHGEIVVIFPEGTRSPDGRIQQGKTGTAALALTTKVPVVPVGLLGTDKVLPKGAALPRLARCQANIGKSMRFDAFYQEYDGAIDQNDQDRIREIEEKVIRMIMKEIARLSGQEYPF